jgi:prepilin-type N-terminal cleavage/methylation domain-containing protein
MKRNSTGNRGFSLIEALIAMVVMSFILVAVGVLYFTSFNVWQRSSAESQADPPAHIAIGRITKELKNAYIVVPPVPNSNTITFTLPETEPEQDPFDASKTVKVNVLPLTPERQITYYVSDATGAVGPTGTVLWRSEQNLLTGASNLKRIADNVEELTFDYAAADGGTRMLMVYAMSVTVQGKEGRHVYRSEFSSRVAFRNASS